MAGGCHRRRARTAADCSVGDHVRCETPTGSVAFAGAVVDVDPEASRIVVERDVGSGAVSKDLTFGRGVRSGGVFGAGLGRVIGAGLSTPCAVLIGDTRDSEAEVRGEQRIATDGGRATSESSTGRTTVYALRVSGTTLETYDDREVAEGKRRELRVDGKLATTDATVEIEEWSVDTDTERGGSA